MAQGKRVATSASAAKIADPGTIVVVTNLDATNSADLGGSGVTAGAGYQLKPGATITVDCRGDELWAIADAGTPSLAVLITRAAGF